MYSVKQKIVTYELLINNNNKVLDIYSRQLKKGLELFKQYNKKWEIV